MASRIAVINGHPDPSSERLCHALATAYIDGAAGAGHEVRRIDVGDLSFPLILTKQDFEGPVESSDISEAQTTIAWANHVVLVYPIWLGTMPALLKGFLEQVFRPKFAFEPKQEQESWPIGGLTGRSARVVVTMGMPGLIYKWYFGAHSLKSLEQNILKFSGLGPVRESIYGMVDAASDARRARWLADMKRLGSKAK
ncbi:MAG: NAD(P)H-dependent oxidoreductase [Pseudomonadota bacterium]